LQPSHAGHRDVEDRQIDVWVQRELHGLGAVTRFPGDFQVWLSIEDEAQSATHQSVVVGEENSRSQMLHVVAPFSGSSKRSSVPVPSVGV
jgi:hypothetical protein